MKEFKELDLVYETSLEKFMTVVGNYIGKGADDKLKEVAPEAFEEYVNYGGYQEKELLDVNLMVRNPKTGGGVALTYKNSVAELRLAYSYGLKNFTRGKYSSYEYGVSVPSTSALQRLTTEDGEVYHPFDLYVGVLAQLDYVNTTMKLVFEYTRNVIWDWVSTDDLVDEILPGELENFLSDLKSQQLAKFTDAESTTELDVIDLLMEELYDYKETASRTRGDLYVNLIVQFTEFATICSKIMGLDASFDLGVKVSTSGGDSFIPVTNIPEFLSHLRSNDIKPTELRLNYFDKDIVLSVERLSRGWIMVPEYQVVDAY